MEERPDPDPGPGADPRSGRGLRRLPHRPACGRRRTAGPEAADRAGPRDRRPDRGRRAKASVCEPGARVGVPWLGHACGHCPYCMKRAREPLRRAALHRLHPRRRLRDPYDRRRGLRVPARRRPRSGRDGAAALRRPDRLALAEGRGRRRGDRHLRLRRRGAYHRAGLPLAGTARLRLHQAAAMRPARPSPARSGRNGRADRTTRLPRRSTQRSCSRRSARSCPPRSRAVRKGGRVVCGGIHMSDIPSFPYRLLWEERERRLGRQSDARRRRRVPGARAARSGVRTTTTPYPLDKANEALDDLRSGRLEGAAVLMP